MSDYKVYLLLNVDDILVFGPNYEVIQSIKYLLKYEFDMKYLGLAKKILGNQLLQTFYLKRIFKSS